MGGALTFSAVSNKTDIAQVEVQGSLLTVIPVSLGDCRIRATARSESNEKADDTFTLTIRNNLPPTLSPDATLNNQVLFSGGTPLLIDLSTIFSDPDGDALVYTAESEATEVAQVSVDQTLLTVVPAREGETEITLSANDQNGGILLQSFSVEVLRGYPSTIQAEVRVTFDDHTDQGNYRMIALPGNQSVLLSNTTTGTAGKDWVAYAPDTSNSGRLIPYEQSSLFVLSPGRGLWFLSKEDWSQPSKTINTVPLNNRGNYEIALHSGWNIISNPLDQDIPWSTVAELNGISQGIWRWNRGYQQIDTFYSTLNIQEAYYFNNMEGIDTLEIPYIFTGTPSALQQSGEASRDVLASATSVQSRLLVRSNEQQPAEIRITWSEEASEGLDRLDQVAPPGHFSSLNLSFDPGHADFNNHKLAVESRSPLQLFHRFDLQLAAEPGNTVSFELNGLSENTGNAILINRLDASVYPFEGLSSEVRTTNTIFIDHSTTPLSLFIGEESAIEEALALVTPDIYTLKQNYPNPFTPSTTIEFSVPEIQHVDLSVFDVMGRHVVTLHKGETTAGLHQVHWNGIDKNQHPVANGVYFYRLQTASWSQTHKMTLIR